MGILHCYYCQYYKNIKVAYSGFAVHSKNGVIKYIIGTYNRINLDVEKPAINEQNALQLSLKSIGAIKYVWEQTDDYGIFKNDPKNSLLPQGELILIKDKLREDNSYKLCWRFDIYSQLPLSHYLIYIDAVSGEILEKINKIRSFTDVLGTAQTRYSGTRNILTNHSTFYYLDENRIEGSKQVQIHVRDWEGGGNVLNSHAVTDNDNNWTASEYHNQYKDDALLDAHWGAENIIDYWYHVHSRLSFDDNQDFPYPLSINGHVDLVALAPDHFNTNDQVGWYLNQIFCGDGFVQFDAVTSLDVLAHEFGHGVADFTINPTYHGETGAIDEGLGDIWGACTERCATTNKNTWAMAEDITLPGYSIRYLNNPKAYGYPDTKGGINWHNPNEGYDYGWVHNNSAIISYWFYLLSIGKPGTNDLGHAYSVVGIGIDNADKLVWRTER
jgi:bacillolysin